MAAVTRLPYSIHESTNMNKKINVVVSHHECEVAELDDTGDRVVGLLAPCTIAEVYGCLGAIAININRRAYDIIYDESDAIEDTKKEPIDQ